ncbi:MAG: 1,4-dihydroxy-2-naphthoate octaprenyltransferase, partial [Candidatus Dormibacteraceae bacterium]
LYTGGPRPYGYLGFGELFVFIFFGLLATVGTVYVQLLTIPKAAWLIGGSLGLLASAILTLNNLRDRETDAVAGKHTLAVRLGASGSWWLLLGEMTLALLLPVLAVAFAGTPSLAVLPLALAPFMVQVLRAAASSEPRRLIAALKRMALIELWFALLWAVGVML